MRRFVHFEAFDVEISDLDLFRCGGSVFLEVFGWRCLVLVGGIDVFVCFATVFSLRVSDMRRLTIVSNLRFLYIARISDHL